MLFLGQLMYEFHLSLEKKRSGTLIFKTQVIRMVELIVNGNN
jgi:hypothetical protein